MTAAQVSFDVVLAVLLLLIGTDSLSFLPAEVVTEIERNSEGVGLALLVVLWLQLVRPRVQRSPWRATAVASVGCLGAAAVLLASDWGNRVRTLNEALLTAGFLLPYIALTRPLPRRVPFGIAAVALGIQFALGWTALVTNLAETVAVAALAPIAFDVVEPQILDPDAARSATGVRVAWYLFVATFPLVVQGLDDSITDGVAGVVIRYASRTTEAFVFVLLLGVHTLLPQSALQRGIQPPGGRPGQART